MIEILNIGGNEVAVERIDEKNFRVNLTQLAKPYGKKLNDWLRLKATQEYLQYRQKKCYGNSRITFDPTYGGQIIVRKGNSSMYEQGTWCTDYHIALDCIAWLDPKRKDVVYDVFIAFMYGQLIPEGNRPIAGVYPILYMNRVFYPYLEILKALGYSTRSGSVAKRKRNYPACIIKLFGRNFITEDLIEQLEYDKRQEARRLELKNKQYKIEFKED